MYQLSTFRHSTAYQIVHICIILFVSISVLYCNKASGQTPIYDCNGKVAVVRLYSDQKKIKAYQEYSNDPKLAKVDRVNWEIKAEKLINERKAYTKEVISNFNEYYKAHEVYYVPDSLWTDFLNFTPGCYVNLQGELDSEIIIPRDKQAYMIARGDYDEDFELRDIMGNDIPGNFPKSLRHSFWSKWRAIMGDGMRESVKRLNKQVKNYCTSE